MTANEMTACGWLRGMKILTVQEVKGLPIGTKLYLIGPDKYGEKNVEAGFIEQLGNIRSRRFRADTVDYVVRKMIRDYPSKVWAVRDDATTR